MKRVHLIIAALSLALLNTGGFISSTHSTFSQELPESRIIRGIEIRTPTGLMQETRARELKTQLSPLVGLNSVYNQQSIDEAIRRLYSRGTFLPIRSPKVEPFEDGVKVIFVLEEKPFVTAVVFRGRQQVGLRDLLNDEPALLTNEDGRYNAYWVQQDARALEEKYRARGFMFAQVTAETEQFAGGVRVRFEISEGTQVLVRRVEFVGNRAISSGELLAQIETREKDWFFGLFRSGIYDDEKLEFDLLNLKMYYRGFGYFDVRIEPESIKLSDDKTSLFVRIRIEEGPVYRFRGYRFSGNAVFSDQTLESLTSAKPGTPFSKEQMERDRESILKYYGDRAYIFANARPNFEYSMDKAEVHVRLTIDEDSEVYIRRVKIQGNEKTQDRVVRRELEFYPGERVDRSKMVKSRSNLARLGFFRDIQYSYEGTGSHRDVVVTVDEDTSGQLIVGFGVTSGFGIIGNLSITKRNFDITDWPKSIYEVPDRFTGAGQRLHLVAQPGTRRSLYRLTFIEPYIFDTPNSLTLSASSLELIREDWEEDRTTFAPGLSTRFDGIDRDFDAALGARFESIVVDVEPGAPAVVVASQGHSAVIAANVNLTYNKVLFEPLEGPYDGHQESILYEYGGGILGGDVDFHKIQLLNAFYFPLYVHEPENLHHVISLENHVGWIDPHDDSGFIPVFERYFIGGPQSVRGFRFRGLGPHAGETPFGGTVQLYGNLEYSFPIFQKLLRGVFFFDYGNLAEDIDSFAFGEMRYAVGGGFRIMFPFLGGQPLPIGLFFGHPISKEPGDRSRLFLFTIGTPF